MTTLELTNDDLRKVARIVNRHDIGHVFTLHQDGTVTEPRGIYAPDVFDDPDDDVCIVGDEWEALTGWTLQYGYHGAVMHASELFHAGIVRFLLEWADPDPVTFALVVVECLTDDGDLDEEPAGWAIVRRREVTQ